MRIWPAGCLHLNVDPLVKERKGETYLQRGSNTFEKYSKVVGKTGGLYFFVFILKDYAKI